MHIRTNQLVEDSNQFALAELEAIGGRACAYTVPESIQEFQVAGQTFVARVDRIPADAVVEVPERQGMALIELGYAEEVTLPA